MTTEDLKARIINTISKLVQTEKCNRLLHKAPVIFLLLLLTSCSSKYFLEPGVIYECNTNQFRGYVVSDGVVSSNEAKLYLDEGQLVAKPRWVTFTHRGMDVKVKGAGYAEQDCQLTPYFAPKTKEFTKGPDYQTQAFKVRTRSDVQYGTAKGYWTSYPWTKAPFAQTYLNKASEIFASPQRLTLDIYEPVGDGKQLRPLRPLLVMVHGGAFFNGDKADEEYARWCNSFAACGYVAISVNYRLGYGLIPSAANVERAGYRAVQDVHAAIRYMLANRDRFSIDPDRIYLAGCSAGAIASLNIAYMTERDKPASVDKAMGGLTAVAPECDETFKIRALCNMWGAMPKLDLLKQSRTSLLSIHGANDPVVPYGVGYPFQSMLGSVADYVMPKMYGSSEIHKRAQQLGLRTELVTVPIAKHTLVRNDPEGDINEEMHDDFFRRMTRFFYDDMVPHPVSISHQTASDQRFGIADPVDVKDYDWQVQGGVIIEKSDSRVLRALMFSDAPVKKVTLVGQYKVGIGFEESLDL